ncbi:hypothetical protein CK203_004873 [Vitis vinifera]|uniref:DUF4283 domain-containing protein n=1 Tax=Vitis vinifera TaxID=29760 RepID=A0A438KGI6_VITVI|nr:hypothetical protein CK203_004873 [Vitis vinifera]
MAKFWVAIESKTFEVSIEEIKGKLKGIIVERSRGFSSWIRFGASGLRKLLECFEECCREEKKGRLVKVWEEEGRKFRLERRVNGAGRYVLCSVVDVEAKRFCLVFPEGKGVIGGATIDDEEERCSGKKKQGEIRSFLDVAKGPAGRVGEELWLQVGGRGLRRREEVLGRCLVGRWEGAVMEMELDSFKNWGKRSWNLRKGVKVMKLGEPFFLLEFEDEGEAERVLNRGTRRFKDRLLHLERWNEEAGCLRDGNQTKEVWVRVVGLPLHCWSEEMFKSIGDCCGGLVGVDEDTKNLSQLQWARILVKNNGNFLPGTLNLVVKSFCYAVRLWWEVQPRVSAVEPMMNQRRREGERMREKGDKQSRAGNSGGKEKEGWRAAGADGSGAVRKRKRKEKCDGDKMGVSVEGLAGYSKKEGEVGSSEKDGVEGLDSCKCGDRWEKGQSSRGGEWAAHEGWAGPVGTQIQSGRRRGQPILASVSAPFAYKSPWDELSVNARASSCLEPAEDFFAEDSLVGGMGPAAAIGTPERCSITDECFLEEASKRDVAVSRSEGSRRGVKYQPSKHASAEERMVEKSTSGFFPQIDGRKEWGEEAEKNMESWSYSCLAKFCHCLGMPTEGCERDILKLLHKMRDRRDRSENLSGKKRKGQRTSRFDRELKKLEWSMNYSGSGGDREHQECVT